MNTRRPTVLYVDDDPDCRDSVRRILEANGYAMLEASTGEAGLRVCERERPDFVLVDLMMEEIDAGTSLVREMKAQGASIPIYMLSSVGENLTMNTDYRELGLDGVLQKPVEADRLLKVLRSKLEPA